MPKKIKKEKPEVSAKGQSSSGQKKDKPSKKKQTFYQAVGRRKEATARVRFYPVSIGNIEIGDLKIKKGEMVVNGQPIENYFSGQVFKTAYMEPFRTTNTIDRFTISAKIRGSGRNSQLTAFIHGVSRTLEKIDKEKFRSILKKKGFLTRDPRTRERRKAGLAHSARAKKQSPKR
ncbi:30S ribosomal protein S9 [Candidatus Microgenomates bacterium]|nr:30S ribosomal protein S9 [Candidatus Microgenomates bacterium]